MILKEGTENRATMAWVREPIVQAVIAATFMVFLLMVAALVSVTGSTPFSGRMPWVMVTAMLLLFAMFNSITCLGTSDPARYWNRSVMAYVALAVFAYGGARLVSGVPIDAAGSFRWLFFVVSFSYLVFVSIVNLIRIIVAFAEKEEWHAPRARTRK